MAAIHLQRVPDGENRLHRELLFWADDSVSEVDSYIDAGSLYLCVNEHGLVGHVLVTPVGHNESELKNLAVVPALRGCGLGQAMLAAVCDQLAKDGITRVFVATSAAAAGNLHFYQRCGFRLLRIERDVFTPARGYVNDFRIDGILAVDQVVMDKVLAGRSS